jgi:hypothetical protein
MPAVNVARTDTFEQQRVKINEIGAAIFNVTAGGSDLSTGILKLGDGTRFIPSLAFTSDSELGLYKPRQDTIGFVANTKKLFDISDISLKGYKDFILEKNVLITTGITVSNSGSGYDEGTYTDVPFIGGTGDGGTAEIDVVGFDGTILNIGANYTQGQYTGIPLIGGNGNGATCEFVIPELEGGITDAGSGYPIGNYSSVPTTTNGSGSNATLNITVSGTTNIAGNVANSGSGYTQGLYAQIDVYNVATQTYVVAAVANPGAPPPNEIYTLNGTNKPVLTLEIGNTYRFDLSDTGLSTHPFYFHGASVLDALPDTFTVVPFGIAGQAGAFVDLVIHDTAAPQTIGYDCAAHAGMGNSISVVSGTPASSGRGSTANVTVDSNGNVTDVTFTQVGEGYSAGDTLRFVDAQIGGGSGATYAVTGVTYNSTVTAATVASAGQDYSANDTLGIDNTFFGGLGSGFEFTVTSNPGKVTEFDVSAYGSGYQVGDLLALPTGVSGLSTVLGGTITGVNTTLISGSAQITVADTSILQVGMNVFNGVGDVGFVAQGAVIKSIDSATTLTMSLGIGGPDAPPDVPGAASLTFTSPNPTQIVLTSVAGIAIGDVVQQTGGTGVLAADTTVSSIDEPNLTVVLNNAPTTPGSATLSFLPSFGIGTTAFSYRVDVLGAVKQVQVINGGNGYSATDVLTVSPTDLVQPITKTAKWYGIQTLTLQGTVSSSAISVGDSIKKRDGAVVQVTLTTGTSVLAAADQTYNNVAATGGSGSGLTVQVIRGGDGSPSVIVDGAGFDYVQGESVTVAGNLVGGATPADDIILEISSITTFDTHDVVGVNSAGGNIVSLAVANLSQGLDTDFLGADGIVAGGNTYTVFTASTTATDYRIFIDDVFTPDLTLYVGSTYSFDLTGQGNPNHTFALSAFEGGNKAPSFYDGYSVTLDDTTAVVSVSSTTNLAVGMLVTASGDGTITTGTKILSVDSLTQITLDQVPSGSGNALLTFTGSEYTDGVVREATSLKIKITDSTPNLYYYDEGALGLTSGFNFDTAAVLTVSANNPKTFGSGLQITVDEVESSDIIKSDVDTGDVSAETFTATTNITTLDATVTQTLTAPDIDGTAITAETIDSASSLTVTTASSFYISSNIDVFDPNTQLSTLSITLADGNLSTQGQLKTLSDLNVNDQIQIETNEIRSLGSNDLLLVPSPGRIANFNTDSALQIPVGDTNARPPSNQLSDGQIRFNTDTQQYEGYNATNSAWSSLGGVRDLDGNTYIKAEASVGANDNTLWFINDGINTLKVTNEYLEFVNCKKISSSNTTAPVYTEWNANTPVTLGQYLKYKNNLFEVTTAGSTAPSGSEPTDTSGNAFVNGTCELTFWGLAVSTLTFEEISEVRVAPLGGTPLVVNGELRFADNIISTDVNDLLIRPNSGKKVTIDTNTSLTIPVGADGDRGAAIQGAIRFNTTSTQFEGYDGTNWGSLGGVKDVDQNTYIIPESAPGANENTLFFYNDNVKTLEVTPISLDFYGIDTIRSMTSNEFEVTASLVTWDNATSTLDNTSATTTFLHTTKQYFDLGLSAGLVVDPVLRLDNQGDVYLNIGFGSGTFDGVKIFDGDLKEFELADTKILSERITLTKGTVNNGSSDLYDIALAVGCKTTVTCYDVTTGEKEFIEFGITDDGTDVFHSEYGNLRTDYQLIIPTFELTGSNVVRLNIEIGAAVPTTHQVITTIVSNVTKK